MAWITILERDGYSVLAAANPLRSVEGDADAVRALLATINTPVCWSGILIFDRLRCPSTRACWWAMKKHSEAGGKAIKPPRIKTPKRAQVRGSHAS